MDREMVQGPGQYPSVKRTALLAALLASLLAGVPVNAASETDIALQAYHDGDFPAAIKIWRKLAAAGNPDAQYALGVAYLKGHGIRRDARKAGRWFEVAAKAGQPLAEALIAYRSGDFATAVVRWRSEAQQDNSDAQYALGLVYLKGQGVPKHLGHALQWFETASKAGNTTAMFNLGGMYWEGLGVPSNPAQAVYWWNRAAKKREPASQFNLALAYYFGRGVPRNLNQASLWLSMAETNGYLGARSVMGLMQRGMLIGGLHLGPGDDAVAGGITALDTPHHESIAVRTSSPHQQTTTAAKPVVAKQLESNLHPQHYTDQLRTLEKRNSQLIDELHKQTGQLKNLTAAHTLIKSTNTALKNENKILHERTTVLQRQLDTNTALTNENKILHERTTVLQRQLDTKTKDDSASNVQLENLNIAYVALEKTNTALLNEKKSLQTTNQNFRSQISELESSLLTREENARALTTQVENLTSQQTTNAASRNELKNQNKQLEKRLDEQRLDTELLETENAGLLNRLQLLEQKHAAALARAASTNASKAVALQESSVPTDAIDRFGAAHQLSADGRLEEAIEAYQALMRDFPQLPQSYNNLAALFAAGGDLEQAEALLRRGLELDNNYRTVRQNLSTLLIYRASRVYREAVDEQGGVTESENSRSIPLLEFELLTSTGQTD